MNAINSFVRIKEIEFINFRNIEHGKVVFPNSKTDDFLNGVPSILGLYGQNGSGKSSVIMALGLLKDILSGKSIDNKYASSIRTGYDRCTLTFTIVLYGKAIDDNQKEVFTKEQTPVREIYYTFDIFSSVTGDKFMLGVENEIIKVKCHSSHTSKITVQKQSIIDTRKMNNDNCEHAFGPKTKYESISFHNDKIGQKFNVAKAIAKENRKSFVFCDKFIEVLFDIINNPDEKIKQLVQEIENRFINATQISSSANPMTNEILSNALDGIDDNASMRELIKVADYLIIQEAYYILISLQQFAAHYLHVIDTTITGITNENTELPLLLWGKYINAESYRISLQMNGHTSVDEDKFEEICFAVTSISNVINKLVPDMTLTIQVLGSTLSKDNKIKKNFEILSNRNSGTIPLKYESDGIRRMVSILSMIIAVYNEPSFTVAIDEIDSGIFEYLLGELLSVMSESTKGQFIFTSHNLRPLEVLPSKYLCFTTTNPQNRFTNISTRGNSNLRDTYFRSIVLGSPKDDVYNSTDRYDIELALYMAGHPEEDMP